MHHFPYMLSCSACPRHCSLTSSSWLKAFARNHGTVLASLFCYLYFIFSSIFRVKSVEMCTDKSAELLWHPVVQQIVQGARFQSITIQLAGRFIPRMLKLMLKQTTCLLVRQLKTIRKWPVMSCHYFLINHRLLQSTCQKMGNSLCWHYPWGS